MKYFEIGLACEPSKKLFSDYCIMSKLSNSATGDVSELNDMLVNIGRMIGELDTATTVTTGLPVQVT